MNQDVMIVTQRLYLTPMTHNFVEKLIAGDMTAYSDLNVKPVDGWPNKDTQEILPIIRDNLAKKIEPDGFHAWVFVEKATNTIVGDGGFKGYPDETGAIDMGYGIVESQRKKGFAMEAVSALKKWALSQSCVKAITADCLKDNIASQKILKNLGMRELKQENGLLYYRLEKETSGWLEENQPTLENFGLE